MRVFVTGGSGFLGRSILRRLVQNGHEVHALARSEAAATTVRAAGGMPVAGDVCSSAALALGGMDAVVHAAAPVVFWADWTLYQRGIVDASVNLYRQAADQGVRRFVYVSSESVLQGTEPLVDIDESQPYADPPNSDYGRAKKEAERALRDAHRNNPHCELIILRPTFIWAPDAPNLQVMAARVRSGMFSWVDGGRAPFEAVHVENVAQAVEAALRHGQPGGTYLITDGRAYTARAFLGPLVAQAAGRSAPTRSMPRSLAMPLASAMEAIWRALRLWRIPPPVTRFEVAFMAQPRRYRIDAALQDLKYKPQHFEAVSGQ